MKRTGTIEGHEARGAVSLVTEGGATVLRIRDLRVAPGAPDVRLYVTPDGDVNSTEAVDFGRIESFEGTRDFTLPQGLAASGLHVIVHCKVFSVEFGRATLR